MATGSLTNTHLIDCQELCALLTCTLDFCYQYGLEELLVLENPIDADPYFEQTMEALFEGRALFFHETTNGNQFRLSKEMIMKAAFEYAEMYPEQYAEIGGADGYIPQIGMKILLIALYGLPAVIAGIADVFEKYVRI